MKINTVMRGYAGLQAFFPTVSNNVQEVEAVNPVSVAQGASVTTADEPRLLAKRSARHARRLAH